MRKVPGFCCHAPGGAEGLLGDLQERAFIGSSWFLLCLRQSPLGSSVSISSRCRNHVSPIRCTLEPCNAYLVELAGIEPASSTHPLQLLQWISPLPRSCSLRADECPSCSPLSCARFLMSLSVAWSMPAHPCRVFVGMGELCTSA